MNLKKQYLIILFFLMVNFVVNSQIKNARITYKVNMNVQNDSIFKLENERGEMLRLIHNEINTIKMELLYLKGKTVFKEIPKLFISKKQQLFYKLAVKSSRLGGVYYTNIKNNSSSIFRTFEGVDYVITSESKLRWKLINENKLIGDLNCQKAESSYSYIDRKGTSQNLKITAWYSAEIPISSGPKNYIGLSGLILELIEGDNSFVIQASKIELNLKNSPEINLPNDVVFITQKKFKEKTKESYSQYFKN